MDAYYSVLKSTEGLSYHLKQGDATNGKMLENAIRVGMLLSLDAKLLHVVGMIIVSDWSWVTRECSPSHIVIRITDSLVVVIAVTWKSLMYQHGSADEISSRRLCMRADSLHHLDSLKAKYPAG